LTILHQGSFEERIEEISKATTFITTKDIEKATGFSQDEVMNKLTEMISSGQLINLSTELDGQRPDAYITNRQFEKLTLKITSKLEEYHKTYPLRPGIVKEELMRYLHMERGIFDSVIGRLIAEKVIKVARNRFSLCGFNVRLDPNQEKSIGRLHQKFDQAPFSPPDCRSLITEIGQELFDYLLSTGEFVRINDDIVFRKTEFDKMLSFVRTTIREQGKLTASEFRDAFNNSRKYALAFLEFLDASGETVREGDYRKLKVPNREQA
jgi:selenocysteine-specific elongation factor